MTIRYVGTCPVCEKQQKVTPHGAMVHHGYKRPGFGNIVGDCYGVGFPAYELSSKGCESYLKYLHVSLEQVKRSLERLNARPATQTASVGWGRQTKTETYRRDSEDPVERSYYEEALRAAIKQVGGQETGINFEIGRMTRLIENWIKRPLLEIDEEGFTQRDRDERDARRAERETKKEAQRRKKSELEAKREERLARRAFTMLFFYKAFEELLQKPPGPARHDEARNLLLETQKKKYGNLDWP